MSDKEQSNGDAAKMEAQTEQSGGDTVDGPLFPSKLPRYRMDFPCVGLCLIINNVNFHPYTGMKTLDGCNYDAMDVENTFRSLGYHIRMFRDLTRAQMREQLELASGVDHSDNASFVCVILSHGEKDSVCGTDGPVKLTSLTQYFKGHRCESLLKKPKLFFINACRGEMADVGGDVVDAGLEPITFRIPLEADFLYAYSTTDGFKAWMNDDGSRFIRVLCDVIQKHRDLELMQMMTAVNGIMAYDCDVWTTDGVPRGKVGRFKQMPSITSMLTKAFYFPNRLYRI